MSWEITLLHFFSGISKCKFSDLPLLALKFTKFIMSFFETKRQFSSNFEALSSVMKDNSSILFHLKLYRLSIKEPIKLKFSDFWVVEWKFNKFFMSCLKLQASFSLNFASLLSVTRDNSSVLFWLKLHMIWTKGADQSAKFQTFHFKFHQIYVLW